MKDTGCNTEKHTHTHTHTHTHKQRVETSSSAKHPEPFSNSLLLGTLTLTSATHHCQSSHQHTTTHTTTRTPTHTPPHTMVAQTHLGWCWWGFQAVQRTMNKNCGWPTPFWFACGLALVFGTRAISRPRGTWKLCHVKARQHNMC